MKKILHILPANAPQTTIPIINTLLSDAYSDFDNKCIVFGKANKSKYAEYEFLAESSNQRVFICKNIWSLLKILLMCRIKIIVSHSDSYIIRIVPLLLGLKVSWICWGATTNISGSILSYVAYPLKYAINHKLHRIITLMLADKYELEDNYKLKNVVVLPYAAPKDLERENIKYFNIKPHNPLKVLIGNSGHCYAGYLKTLDLLVKFKDDIEVHCMFQYPLLPDQINELRRYGENLFNNKFHVDVDLLSKHDYYMYMSTFDIYICPKPTQSGLGAIHTSLLFGKKVYLTGKNLEWEQYIGTKVFNIADIELIGFKEFSNQLTLNEKNTNRDLILRHWDRTSEWLEFYRCM